MESWKAVFMYKIYVALIKKQVREYYSKYITRDTVYHKQLLPLKILINYMEQSSSWKVKSNSSPFTEPDGSLPCSQKSGIGPFSDPDTSSPNPPKLFP